MQRSPAEEGHRWFRQAARDLDDARYAAAGGRFNLACFVAQQAAEKALKAFLYAAGRETVWGHSVAELCTEAAALDGRFARLAPDAAPLDKYYIPTRYPNGLPGGIPADAFVAADAQAALDAAQRVLDVVNEAVS